MARLIPNCEIDYFLQRGYGLRTTVGGTPVPCPSRRVILLIGNDAFILEKDEGVPKKLRILLNEEVAEHTRQEDQYYDSITR